MRKLLFTSLVTLMVACGSGDPPVSLERDETPDAGTVYDGPPFIELCGCVYPEVDAGTDGGSEDGGVDGGDLFDGGSVVDAGEVPDAGSELDAGVDAGTSLVVCHKPNGPSPKTLVLDTQAEVCDHIKHGDHPGACQ